MNWPSTADGDVFRRLESAGFDFTKPWKIDFEVDFESWPPSPEAVDILTSHFPSIQLIEPDSGSIGYAHLELNDFLTYEFVIAVQAKISLLVADHGGKCEAWGVLHG